MKNKLSEQFSNHMKRFIESQDKGELINIYEVYVDYAEPKYQSPRRLLRYRPLKNLANYLIEKNDYNIEKVIKYSGKDVYVCCDLAITYLMWLDTRNHIILNEYLMELGAMDKLKDFLRKG